MQTAEEGRNKNGHFATNTSALHSYSHISVGAGLKMSGTVSNEAAK